MTNIEIVEAVELWQSNEQVHPLICGNFWKHENELLVPVVIEDKVYLECQKCSYLQETIPECVIEYYRHMKKEAA